jgi:lactate dehydrogenase-like 2-hydroxyacid dehydrogenase
MTTRAPLKVVRLDGIHCAGPALTIPHIYTEYPTTTPTETPSRIREADIIITARVPLTAAHLAPESTPQLQMVAVMATGTEIVDLRACRERGILVCNVPASSNQAVAEHAFALFMAVRRRVVRMQKLIEADQLWPERGTCAAEFEGLPMGWAEEIVGIVGVGELG